MENSRALGTINKENGVLQEEKLQGEQKQNQRQLRKEVSTEPDSKSTDDDSALPERISTRRTNSKTWRTSSCCCTKNTYVSKEFVVFVTHAFFTGVLILFCFYMIASNDRNRELWIGLLVSAAHGYRKPPSIGGQMDPIQSPVIQQQAKPPYRRRRSATFG